MTNDKILGRALDCISSEDKYSWKYRNGSMRNSRIITIRFLNIYNCVSKIFKVMI